MHLQIVSGAPSVTFQAPNKYIFTLPSQYEAGENDQVALKSCRMYYSWWNVSAAKGNNQFSYRWVDGTVHTVTLQDGIWGYADFQAYFEQIMRQSGHYLIDGTTPVYYIRFDVNSVFYRISLTCTPVPATIPAGWTAPAGFVFPATATTPQILVPATNVTSYLGFAAGTYPAVTQPTLFQVNGTIVPQVTDISSLQLQTNLTFNEYGPDTRTLATFNVPPGLAPGSIISEVPFYQDWIPVQPRAKFKTVTLELADQNGRKVKIEDPTGFQCALTIRTR